MASKEGMLLFLLLYCVTISSVMSSHFRGGIIMVRPQPGGGPREMEISYHVSWRRNSRGGGSCSSLTVNNGLLLRGEGSMVCQYGCSGTITTMSYICTDFSIDENWSFGEYRIAYNFTDRTEDTIAIGFTGRCWISPLGCNWNISTTFSLNIRNDTGHINSSPRAITTPVLRLQQGCNHTIPLAVSDPDGDIIKCRWAVGRECAGVCNVTAFPGAQLDSDTCTIHYEANRGARVWAAAVMIEDFIPGSLRPISSVALQFIVLVVASTDPCSQQPEFIDPTPLQGSCVAVPPGITFATQLTATSGSSSASITEIQTVSPIGTRRGELQQFSGTNIYFVNITWEPAANQLNESFMFCYVAVNSVGLASEQSCIQLLAGTFPPTPNPGESVPSQHLVHPSNITLPISFDRNIQRPSVTAYIVFYKFNSGREIYRIDVALSPEVDFDKPRQLVVSPNFLFAEKGKFYINLQRGVVRGTEGCGPPNEPVTSRTFWTFEVLDVTPPVLRYIQNPTLSNGNISLSWESNENVTWECSLVVNSITSSVNCSGANWRGYNLSEGRYELMITATDDAGNVATLVHTFEVDLTPPTVTIVRVPPSLSNQVRSTIRFSCDEFCTAECQLSSDVSEGSPISCNSRSFITPSLQHNNSYTLSIIALDRIGNRAQPVSYQWETDFVSPVVFGVSNTSVPCSKISPVITGQAEASDDRSTFTSLTYSDQNLGCFIRRTWVAMDDADNRAQLVQTIELEFSPVLFLSPQLSFPCDSASGVIQIPENTITTPNPCRLPLQLSFEDSVSEHNCPSEFVRNWTVNICGSTVSHSQNISLFDVCPVHACGRNESTPRGVCTFGECQCSRPFFGEDCDDLIHEPIADIVRTIPLQEAQQFSTVLNVSQGTPPLTWTLVFGPPQLRVDQFTGQVSWDRVRAGNHTIIVQVENQVGQDEISWNLTVIPGYSTFLNPVSPRIFPKAQPIVLTGIVQYTPDNVVRDLLVGFVPVYIDITSNGVTRTLVTVTDRDGSYSLTFYPAMTEHGLYQATSRHPSVSQTTTQTEWGILGLTAIPNRISLTGEAISGFEEIFHNVTIVSNGGPGDLDELSATSSLRDAGTVNVTVLLEGLPFNGTLTAGNQVAVSILIKTLTPLSGSFAILIGSRQGTSLQISVSFQIRPILPSFLIEPSSLNTRIIRGTSRIFEITVTNTGRITANNIRPLLPSNNVISLVSFGNAQQNGSSLDLGTGQSAMLSLLVQTPETQSLGEISTTIAVISAQVSASIPVTLTVSSDVLMNLTVFVEDEFTYFASDEPLVNDAAITLINYQRGIRITLTTEAGNGTVTFINIHEDRYEMFVEAPDHLTVHQVIITSVDDPVIPVFMQRQTVTYTWSVTPVTFEDNYVLTVEADFVTRVPIPIVTVTPEEIDLELFELGFYSALQINITNQGLIRANDGQLQFPDGHPFLEFISDTTELGDIEPLSSTIVTINVSRRSIEKRVVPVAVAAGAVLRIGAGLAARAAGAAARAAVAAARSAIRRTARNLATSTRAQWITYAVQVAYSYVCRGEITRTIPVVLKKLVLIESLVPQPIVTQIGCISCSIRGPSVTVDGPTFNFRGYSARTPAFCDPCIQALVGCAPTPSLPLIGCIPLYLSGSRPLQSTVDAINWVSCAINFKWLTWITCGVNVASMCLDVNIGKKRQSLGRSVNELEEAMYPVLQSIDLAIEVLGDEAWLSVGDPLWVSNILQPSLDDSSDAGILISTGEYSTILTAPPPNGTTTEMIQRLVERLNNTLQGWSNGQLEPVEGTNMVSFSTVEELSNTINTYNNIAIDKGFSSYIEAYSFASGEINQLESWEEEEGVCAVVRIRIEQELAVTRTAFLARLEIENMEAAPLQDGSLEFIITNSGTGEQATHLFAIGNGSLSGSLTDGDGGWTLPSEASGSIEWLIIPFSEAAPESDRSYGVGGTLRYSLDDENITIPLVPTVITVTPDPSLLVHYFWERFVVGDDPFTDEVEDSVPFTLGVAVKNAGHGVARSVQITSGQPEIIENERGLLINFMIIGAMIGNGSIEPSLTVMFGDVPPDTTKVARWQIISSLQGEFRNYSATFENINPLGDPNLSILDELEIHELIRNVRIYNSPEDDGVLDFLVNELDDLLAFPDALYSSKTLEHYNVSVGTILSVRSITTTLLEVRTFTNTTGWVYYRYADSENLLSNTAPAINATKREGNYTTSIPSENSWITRDEDIITRLDTFYLHIFDNITTNGEMVFNMSLCTSDCPLAGMRFSRSPTAPIVTFTQSTYNVDEDDGPVQPVLILSNPSSTDITISVFSTDGSATGGGVDYSSGPYNVTIPAGQISVTFDVPINDDNVFEENEEFHLTIDQFSSLNGVIIGSPNVAVVNMSDNDAPTLKFNQSAYNVDEDDGPAQPVLVLSNPSSTDITISVFSTDGSATGGGIDYSSGPYNVTIPTGQISVLFDVPINDDNVPEKRETFLLTIDQSSSLNGVIIGSPHVTVVNISDNDAPTINFTQSTYSVDEDDGPAQPVLVLSNPSSADVTISVFSTDGSATGGGVDYSSGPYNVTIPAGQIGIPFDVPINDDNVFEEKEDFLLTIDQSSSLSGVIIGSPNVAVVTILDNDAPTVTINQSTYNVDEDDGPAQPVLVLSNPSSTDITISVFSTDGSAIGGGVDYSSGPYNVRIPAGQISVPFDVPINDDNVFEENEEFFLTIDQSSSLDGVIIGSPNVTVVTILDNDCTPCTTQPITGEVTRRRVTVTFSASDPMATFNCRLDRRRFQPCTSPMTWRGLSRGRHTVAVVARCSIICGSSRRLRRYRFRIR